MSTLKTAAVKHPSSSGTAITLDASDNVGIGTATPNSVTGYGALTLDGTSGSFVDLEENGTLIGRLAVGSNQVDIHNKTANPITFQINNSEAARFDSNGHLILKKNLVLDSTSEGIDFSGVGSSAQTLGTYEEGTWSPFWANSSDNAIFDASPTVNFAHYTKIGRSVSASCYFNMPGSFGTTGGYSSGGALRIGGLPFTAFATGSANYYAGTVGWFANWTGWDVGASSYGYPPFVYTVNNTTSLQMVYPSQNGIADITQGNVNNGSSGIILSVTYFTSA